MSSDFLLVLLAVTLVYLACSAQKSAHTLCLSGKFANCKQLDKISLSKQHPLNIVLRQQLSINFFSVSSIDSTSINFQFSQKQFFFLPLPEIYLATFSTKINFHGIWQNHSSRRAKLLASLKSLKLPTSNLFGQAKNIRLLVKFFNVSTAARPFQSTETTFSHFFPAQFSPSIYKLQAIYFQHLGSGNSIYFRHPDSGNSIIIMTIHRRSIFRSDGNNVGSRVTFYEFHFTNIQNQGSGHSFYYRQSIQTLAKQDTLAY